MQKFDAKVKLFSRTGKVVSAKGGRDSWQSAVTKQPVGSWLSAVTNRPVNESTSQPIDQSTNQPVNQSTSQPINLIN
jgi:hypothetical protein